MRSKNVFWVTVLAGTLAISCAKDSHQAATTEAESTPSRAPSTQVASHQVAGEATEAEKPVGATATESEEDETSEQADVDAALKPHSPNQGKLGKWIRTKLLDVQINAVQDDGPELPQMNFENRFGRSLNLLPCVFRVEYQDGTKVEGINECDGSGISFGEKMGGSFTTLRLKGAPSQGKLERVDVVYGLRGEIPEKDWVRFVATR
jgi:hypothetical protein